MIDNKLLKGDMRVLDMIASMPEIPVGSAFNIRKNGDKAARSVTENIDIRTKEDGSGIDIIVKAGTKGEKAYIPVLLTESGLDETVANDFIIGDGAEVEIIAGCGICNSGSCGSSHSGVHTFKIGKGCRVKYVEKHYGEGDAGTVMNPTTVIMVGEDSVFDMESSQIRGISSTKRNTVAYLAAGARMNVSERLVTHGTQDAKSDMEVYLNGKDSSLQIVSRSVAQDSSSQMFHPKAIGNTACSAHIQCDAIIMDTASVGSIPEIQANSAEASIIHEAAIGRINNEQLLKLQTLGLTAEEAEAVIIEGFLS
ncbi:MAG: SufD family Fe-S cluster assembly protein [Clostridia bacterium]|nr:SufD family Fe-S cluster assembly protein [Clostridia bacterium]